MSSCFILLPYRRLLPDGVKKKKKERTQELGRIARAIFISIFLVAPAFSREGGKCLQPSCSLYYDFPVFLKIEEALWCRLSYYSALDQLNLSFMNTLCQFLPLRETNVHLEFIPPSPCAHWLPETQFFSPLKCCVQNGDFLHGKFAQLPAAYPLHKFKECFGVVLEGPFFLTSQPISLCFELRSSRAM